LGPTTTSSTVLRQRSSRIRDAENHHRQPWTRRTGYTWLDILIAVGCLGGLTISTLYQLQVRAADYGASDFKTLYASVWCFTHRINAYSIANIQQVFVANGVVQPEHWFGHAPVYPWITLALLSPLASMGMVPAAYVLIILSGVLMIVAVAALMRYAANNFDMGPGWRIAMAVLCASGPLLSFGINLGNVSVAASAFCFLAFVWRKGRSPWIRRGSHWIPSAALAAAFVLKPHLALWVGIGMLLLPERAARAVVMRAGVLIAGFTALTAGVMAATGTLGLQTHAYFAMLSAEASTGSSMSATSRTVLPVVAEITSLNSILGFWISNPVVRVTLTFAVLLGLGLLALRLTRQVNSERAALLAVGAWCTLGFLATYHRSPDAILLLMLLPWALDRVRRTPWAWHAWVATILYCALSVSADFPVVERWIASLPTYSPLAFLLLRQAGLADCLLLFVLLLALERERARKPMQNIRSIEADETQAVA
jgi:hypothetical protein